MTSKKLWSPEGGSVDGKEHRNTYPSSPHALPHDGDLAEAPAPTACAAHGCADPEHIYDTEPDCRNVQASVQRANMHGARLEWLSVKRRRKHLWRERRESSRRLFRVEDV